MGIFAFFLDVILLWVATSLIGAVLWTTAVEVYLWLKRKRRKAAMRLQRLHTTKREDR